MVTALSESLRKLFLAHSEEELAQLARRWGIYEKPTESWREQPEKLSELMQDPISARFAWEGLSPLGRHVLHVLIINSVGEAMLSHDLQQLATLDDGQFAAALQELQQRLMLSTEPAGPALGAYGEMDGEKRGPLLVVPKDFRALLINIEEEIYDLDGDRSTLPLVELLQAYGPERLRALSLIYDHYGQYPDAHYYTYHSYSSAELAHTLAGQLVQPKNLTSAWKQLDSHSQRICRWLCQHEGKAELALARIALSLSDEVVSKSLRQLATYGLVFDTFLQQKRLIFIGKGVSKVLCRTIETFDTPGDKAAGYVDAQTSPSLETPEKLPETIYEAEPLALYDLAVIIGAAYQMVIEPTQSNLLPKRLANKLLPLVYGRRPSPYGEEDYYIDILFHAARQMKLLALHEQAGQKPHFVPGENLAEWAMMDTTEQTRRLLELWWNPANYFWGDLKGLHYRPNETSYSIETRTARKALTYYLSEYCEIGKWYTLQSLLHSIKQSNYLLLRGRTHSTSSASEHNLKAALATWDQVDGEIIAGMLASTLYEFGLVSLAYEGSQPDSRRFSNPTAFKLTELAQSILHGRAGVRTSAAPREQTRHLIVQPNFEMLLLQPDNATLYQLLPFSKVNQIGMVSRLVLTQESVRRGIAAGWSVERVLDTLQNLVQKELPQNVLYTLQDWGRLYKDTTISQILLLEVNSEAVADEICASAKFRTLALRRLGPCAVAVGNQISLQTLRTTLEKEGVIVRIQGDILTGRESSSKPPRW
jgi:hypothetical protein